ncbi:Tuberous sclerosis 2-like protein [Microbotryomycetes sp. JL221]|nr:Tuberous sclerosis 2-like protein [Microbotryomycetes sp. JL221]
MPPSPSTSQAALPGVPLVSTTTRVSGVRGGYVNHNSNHDNRTAIGSGHPASSPSSGSNPIASLFKSIGRNVSRAAASSSTSSTSPPPLTSQALPDLTHFSPRISRRTSIDSKDTSSTGSSGFSRPTRSNMAFGSSSRGAGVRPRKSKADAITSVSESAENEMPERDDSTATSVGGYSLAGPSRGGFVTHSRGKTAPTVAATGPSAEEDYENALRQSRNPSPGPSSSRGAGRFPSPHRRAADTRASSKERRPSTFNWSAGFDDDHVLPPSKILPRLHDAASFDPANEEILASLIRLLAKSVSLYPFPPPTLAAASLSEALASHPSTPRTEHPADRMESKPSPTPVQIYLSQSRHLSKLSSPVLRAATLELMNACLEASLGSTGGIMEREKAVYWDEARRWSEEAKVEVDDGQGGTRRVLPEADRESLVTLLNLLTKGGRDLSDVPGLINLLCTFVHDSIALPRPPSPLFDPNLSTHFVRTIPSRPSKHASALTLITNLQKFSAPSIYTSSTLNCLRTVLEVAHSRDEPDIGGSEEASVLNYLAAVVRFGEVTGGKSAQRQAHTMESGAAESSDEGNEILREVVELVARIIGCENLIGVIEVHEGDDAGSSRRPSPPSPQDPPTSRTLLTEPAHALMRDLIRSPANQALRSLRNSLTVPPTQLNAQDAASLPPQPPVLLLVGTLRALRRAFSEHSQETDERLRAEAQAQLASNATSSAPTQMGARYPSLLTLGLPWVFPGLRRVVQWKNELVDAEVLRLVEERIEDAEKIAAVKREIAQVVAAINATSASTGASSSSGAAGQGQSTSVSTNYLPIDESDATVSYELWDLAIQTLEKLKWHVSAWEAAKLRTWVLEDHDDADRDSQPSPSDDEAEEDGPRARPSDIVQKPDVLAAFSSLLRRIVRAWKQPGFAGPSSKLFQLLQSLAPSLPNTFAETVLEQAEATGVCWPVHPDWLERTQAIVKAFYVLPSRGGAGNSGTRTIKGGASVETRRRALLMLQSLYEHLRHSPSQRQALVNDVVLPLMETSLDNETDLECAEIIITLAAELVRDVLTGINSPTNEDGPIDTFERIRRLLLKTAKGSSRSHDRQTSSTYSTPKKRGIALTSLSRFNSPAQSRSTPSVSDSSPSPAATNGATAVDPHDVQFLTILGLITLFHLALMQATDPASERAVIVFRDLLTLLAPSALPASDVMTDVKLSMRSRLLILQWLVRLRADASHRIYWVKDVDITGPATILSRLSIVSEETTEGLAASMSRFDDAGKNAPSVQQESRGRSVRKNDGPGSRGASSSRLRIQSEERSPSRSASVVRRPGSGPVGASQSSGVATVSAQPLWTVPEMLPFEFLEGSSNAVGGKSLASFDHNRMREWTEEEDPGTGQLKVKEAPDSTPVEDPFVVLPVSEYLATACYILQYDQEWELVSYILCHLPEQLANKHFPCGPRAAQQIHLLRRILCDALRASDRSERVFPRTLPVGVKRAEIHAVGYHCLTSLIAYRSLFNKSQQDDMVDTFMHGLSNPRDTAKPCIHALGVAASELRPSVTKHLAEIMRHLQKIISSATLGVHILEFIAGVGQEPALYANFTEIDFQTVFGIALKYIQAHNERLADNPENGEEEGVEYAFSQYVFLMAYYSIAAWFLALRLSERPKYVPFLTRRLVQANEGKTKIDDATEVCFDMIARYAYSNADPRPRPSSFDKIITTGRAESVTKTWIVGSATITFRSLRAPAWVEVTIRRASGVARMLWELQNISGVTTASETDMVAMYLRHRETQQVSIPSVISSALAGLPSHGHQPHLGTRSRSASISGGEQTRPSTPLQTIESNVVSDAINSAAATANQPTLESGLLSVDPSFFTLQLSSYPEFSSNGPPILVPDDPAFQRGITALDRIPVVDFHKIGIMYAAPGQTSEQDILRNTHGSKAYTEFVSALGKLVRLKGSRDQDIYVGGLDQENDLDGKWTYIWDDDIAQVVFHVTTLMPTSLETDAQCTLKKRHVGNDYVNVIWNDSGLEHAFGTVSSQFEFINILIEPHTPAGNPWIGPGMSNNSEFFKVSMQRRPGMPEIGPLGTFKMITGSSLPHLIRQLALHCNIMCQIWLDCVGLEVGGGRTTKLEYKSNWRRRLEQIRTLKQRIKDAKGGGMTTGQQGSSSDLEGGAGANLGAAGFNNGLHSRSSVIDLEEAEQARLFTSWLSS